MLRFALAAAALFIAADVSAQTYEGRLALGDVTLTSGEFVDEYEVEAVAGDTVRAVVSSEEFDTYVILVSSSGEQAEDDDCVDGDTTRSCGEWVADVDGPVRVLVTSFQPGEAGSYEVVISVAQPSDVVDGRDDQ